MWIVISYYDQALLKQCQRRFIFIEVTLYLAVFLLSIAQNGAHSCERVPFFGLVRWGKAMIKWQFLRFAYLCSIDLFKIYVEIGLFHVSKRGKYREP